MFLKIAIPLYSLLLFIAVAVKKAMVQKKIGKNPVIMAQTKSAAESYLKKLAFLFFPLWIGGMNLAAFFPELAENIPHLNTPYWTQASGVGLLFLSWFLFVLALVHLKEAWRFGIDWEGTNQLITYGIYGAIRHPIYASLKMALIASLVLFPNIYFLWIGTATFFGLSLIACLEEDFLKTRFGNQYAEYMKKTGRFVPRLKC